MGRRWGQLHSSPSLRAELLESSGQPWPLGNSQPVGWAQISENITLEGRVWFSCISDCRSHEVHFRQFGKYIKKLMRSSEKAIETVRGSTVTETAHPGQAP